MEADDENAVMEASDDISQQHSPTAIDPTVSAASSDETLHQQQHVATLQQQLADNPMQYELHVQLLRLLRSLHETDALRDARLRMASLFPLTADLWQEWLDDDKQRIDSHDDQVQLLALHKRACQDYLVPQLWIQYTQYAEQLLHSPDEQQWGDEAHDAADSGVNRVRDVYEQAVRAVGAHRLDGEKVWRAYRKFEVRVLTQLLIIKQQREDEEVEGGDEEEDAEDEDESGEEKQEVAAVRRQLDRIVSLYRRSLALPLNGLEQAYSEYKQWMEQAYSEHEVEADITAAFKQAKTQRDARTPYEKSLPHSDTPTPPPHTGILTAEEIAAWYAYIQFEHQQSAKRQPARVTVLYERALVASFLHTDMWSAYTLFLEERGSRPERKEDEEKRTDVDDGDNHSSDNLDELLSVYQRAVRNVPHSAALWCGLIRTLERRGVGQDDVLGAYQRASEALTAVGGDELASVCLAVVDLLRRQLRAQLQRENRSRSRSPMRSPTKTSSTTNNASSASTTTLSLPFSRPPSKRAVIDTALDTIRPILRQAVQALRYHNPATSHPTHHTQLTTTTFLTYHSLERHTANDTTAARDVLQQWTDIAGTDPHVWIEWARLEVECGELQYARQVYKRGLERLLLDWGAESMCWEWLRFEREHGSVDDYCHAWRRCEKLFRQFDAARAAAAAAAMQSTQSEETSTADGAHAVGETHDGYAVHTDGSGDTAYGKETKREKRNEKKQKDDKKSKKRNRDDNNTEDSQQSIQADTASAEQTSKKKKPKTEKEKKKKRQDNAAVVGADKPATEEQTTSTESIDGAEVKQQPQQIDGVQTMDEPAAAATSTSTAADSSQQPATTSEFAASPITPVKLDHIVDHPTRTLLVSNLSWITTRDTLHSLFQSHGTIDTITLHADAAHHKQYAYVVYTTKEPIKAAVTALHSHTVDGSSVEVECVAHRHKRDKAQQKAAAHRSLTTFIKQLHTRDDVETGLRQHFAACGTIAHVRLSRDSKSGELKGVAWIEWADKDAFDKALQLDGSVMEGDEQPIRVMPDRPPPPRKESRKEKVDEQGAVVAKQRSRLLLMPRTVKAVQERDKSGGADGEVKKMQDVASRETATADDPQPNVTNDLNAQPSPMSNTDFRAMLMRRS